MKLGKIIAGAVVVATLSTTMFGSDSPAINSNSWKLTLPLPNDKGTALEIKNPELSQFFDGSQQIPAELNNYFKLEDQTISLTCAYTGVTTSSNTKYSRTEFREMKGDQEFNWTLENGGTMTGHLKISDLKGPASKIIFMQIHGKKPQSKPLLKCIWEKGKIRLLTKSGKKLKDLKTKKKYTKVKLDEWFSCSINVSPETLVISVNGEVIETYGPDVLNSWPKDNSYYFKAGNYLQHAEEGAGATVVYKSLAVSHLQ